MKTDLDELSPKEIVSELDRYIVGQKKAKKAVAIALRNRLRRQKLSEELRNEIAPKNIIMIGPTGVGKTEIARRLAKLCRAPFIKVEATKYTEVGYVGRDVESMVRDLTSVSVNMVKAELQEGHKEEAEKRVEDELINLLLPSIENRTKVTSEDNGEKLEKSESENGTREVFKKRLEDGEFEEKLVWFILKPSFPRLLGKLINIAAIKSPTLDAVPKNNSAERHPKLMIKIAIRGGISICPSAVPNLAIEVMMPRRFPNHLAIVDKVEISCVLNPVPMKKIKIIKRCQI